MSNNRKAAEAVILENIEEMLPGGENKAIYANMFAAMSDSEFEDYIKALKDGSKRLAVVAPNFGKSKLSLERNFALAKKLNHKFFQRVWVPAKNGNRSYLSPVPYLVVDLPLRRQAQLLQKKISIPEDNNSVDDFTGQPTGKSKGAKISYPEVQVIAAMGLDNCLQELLKYRGGDERGFNAMNTVISRTGRVDMKTIAPYAGGVKSTKTLDQFFRAMHLKSTLRSK